jgi:hypothetical protein
LCTSQLASEGNEEAHKYLITYFTVKKINQQKNPDRYLQNPAIFATTEKNPEVIAFSKLRGKEAFELALAYIETCVCRPFIKHSDGTYPSEETFTIIDFVISPMIRTIGGHKWLDSYFRALSIDRFQNSFLKFSPEEQHALHFNALVKAYKEGKVVLKEYGEEERLKKEIEETYAKDCKKSLEVKDIDYEYIISHKEPIKFYDCMFASDPVTNMDARRHLLFYFKEALVKNEVIQECKGMMGYAPYEPEAKAFARLRGEEAFELAMQYASETKCIHVEHDPSKFGGNIGLNVIKYIISPMIKSVDGEPSLDAYLTVNNGINKTVKPSSTDECKRDHEVLYKELVKAYKEGKIVLKQYGEE